VTRNAKRGLAIAALVAGVTILSSPAPAQALPPGNPGQSVTITYYSNASRTDEVGWWSYGSCGEPFDIGTHTSYFSVRVVTCGPGGGL
jgi:hypothetical protein